MFKSSFASTPQTCFSRRPGDKSYRERQILDPSRKHEIKITVVQLLFSRFKRRDTCNSQ